MFLLHCEINNTQVNTHLEVKNLIYIDGESQIKKKYQHIQTWIKSPSLN